MGQSRVYVAPEVGSDYPSAAPFHPSEAYPELVQLGEVHISSTPNRVYAAVRSLLLASGLDRQRFGSAEWNPLGELAPRGGTVVLKPNMVRHFNETAGQDVQSVVTHWSLVRAIGDYALMAVGPDGRVRIVEAPQHDCDLNTLRTAIGVDQVLRHWARSGRTVGFIDARKKRVIVRDGVLMKTVSLPGDPEGAVLVDLADASEFCDRGLDATTLRGSDYDDHETELHHSDGRHEYLLAKSVMTADLVVSLPKLKTHGLIGMTAASKNLVGINADKNYLPHWRVGFRESGGDQFARSTALNRLRMAAFRLSRPLLRAGPPFTWIAVGFARVLHACGLRENFGGGMWHGNDTIWRTTLDVNKAFLYANSEGRLQTTPFAGRKYLCLVDAVVVGEGRGPLSPTARRLGLIALAMNPIACDAALARLCGFDWRRLAFLQRAYRISALPVTAMKSPSDVAVILLTSDGEATSAVPHDDLVPLCSLRPAPGWVGYIELPPSHGSSSAEGGSAA